MISQKMMDEIVKIKTMDELKDVWAAMKQRQNYLQSVASSAFQVGDKVSWYTTKRGGKTVVGTVTKINQKTVSVSCGADGNWKVSGSLLKRVV
jgi:hypothetical protein